MTILIVTPELHLADKVRNIFLRQYSPLSGQSHSVIEGYESALLGLEAEKVFEAIVVVSDEYSEPMADFMDHVERHSKGPMIIMSDNAQVSERARSRGLKFILPRSSVDQDVFKSILDAAADHYRLGESVQKLEKVYETAEQRFKDVAEHFADWLWEIDKSLNITFSSSAKRSMENVEIGMQFSKCFLPEEATRIEDEFLHLFKEPRPFHDEEYWSFDAFGTRRCWALSGVPIFDKCGNIAGYRGVARDISNEKASVDHLYFLSNNDALTGFYNRSRFVEELARSARTHVREGKDGALVLLNLNRFRYINDRYGYEVGDKVIVHVAQMLKGHVRSEDFVARVGADEFAVILRNTTLEEATLQAKSLIRAISTVEYMHEGKALHMTVRGGGVSLGGYGSTSDDLISRAHVALVEAKKRGTNTFSMFDDLEARQKDASSRMEMLNFLSKCLEDDPERLVLYYQPIVSLSQSSRTERYEVLVRMLDDDGNIISPVKFIEIAEEFGLISKLDRIVASRSLDKLEEWQRAGKDIALSINISGRTFEDKDEMARITQHLGTKTLTPGSVIFELTETSALQDVSTARRVISELKSHGAQFALDDCGVGYSSLDYIRQLDLDYIKIDGSFIRDLHRNKEDDAFVRALRDVARRLEIKTVAEMVEDEETVQYLKNMGIDFAQGYHFAMPQSEILEDFDEAQGKTLN